MRFVSMMYSLVFDIKQNILMALYKVLLIVASPMEQSTLKNVNNCLNTNIYSYLDTSEAVFLVVCDLSINKL